VAEFVNSRERGKSRGRREGEKENGKWRAAVRAREERGDGMKLSGEKGSSGAMGMRRATTRRERKPGYPDDSIERGHICHVALCRALRSSASSDLLGATSSPSRRKERAKWRELNRARERERERGGEMEEGRSFPLRPRARVISSHRCTCRTINPPDSFQRGSRRLDLRAY